VFSIVFGANFAFLLPSLFVFSPLSARFGTKAAAYPETGRMEGPFGQFDRLSPRSDYAAHLQAEHLG
jgi:hypothetical protein